MLCTHHLPIIVLALLVSLLVAPAMAQQNDGIAAQVPFELKVQLGHAAKVNSVVVSPDGKFALSGSDDQTMKLWDIATGKLIRTFSILDHPQKSIFSAPGMVRFKTSLSDYVTSVAFSPNSLFAISASYDGMYLWDLKTGHLTQIFDTAETNSITSTKFSPDGKLILTAHLDSSIKLWNAQTGKVIKKFLDHTKPVSSVAFLPDQDTFLSASQDKTLKLWNIQSGKVVQTLTGQNEEIDALAINSNGHLALAASGKTSENRGKLNLWDLKLGKIIYSFLDINCHSVAFSPDSKFAVSGGTKLILWDLKTGKAIRERRDKFGEMILTVAYHPSGKTILSGSHNNVTQGIVSIWDVYSNQPPRDISKISGNINNAEFNYNSQHVLTSKSDGSIYQWDLIKAKASPVFYKKSPSYLLPGMDTVFELNHSIEASVYSPDGKYMLSAIQNDQEKISLWDLSSKKIIKQFSGHNAQVKALAFSNDGSCFVSGDDKHNIFLWDIKSEKIIKDFVGHSAGINSVAISPDGNYLLSGGDDSTVRLWHIATAQTTKILTCPESFGSKLPVRSVKFSPDGKLAISATGCGVNIWDLPSEQIFSNFWYDQPFYNSAVMSTHGKHILFNNSKDLFLVDKEYKSQFKTEKGPIRAIAFNPDGSITAVAHTNTVKLWDAQNHKLIRTFNGHENLIYRVDFNKTGTMLLSSDLDGKSKVWDVKTGQVLQIIDALSDEKNGLFQVDLSIKTSFFNEDKNIIVINRFNNTIKIWDVKSGKLLNTYTIPFLGFGTGLAFSPDLKHFLIGPPEGQVKLFETETAKEIRSYSVHMPSLGTLEFSPDGKFGMTHSFNGSRLWNLETGAEIVSYLFANKPSFSPNGRFLLFEGAQNFNIFDLQKGHFVNEIPKPLNTNASLQQISGISSDGKQILIGDSEGKLTFYNFNLTHKKMLGHSGNINSVNFSKNNKWLLSGSDDGTFKIWDASTGRTIMTGLSSPDEGYIMWTPDGYFDGSPNSSHLLHMVQGLDVFSIDQFALKYNRPDIILERLGSPETERIKHYKQLYLRRLAKAGLSESQLSGELHAPVAEIKSQQQTDKHLQLSFELTDSKYPLKTYNIYVNDVPLYGTAGKVLSGQSFKATEKIELNTGENKIEVSVLNNRGAESYRAMTTASYEKPVKGELYFLGFGVSDYQDSELNLKYAHKDALDLEKALKQLPEFKQVHSQVFTNQQATSAQIKQAKSFLQQATVDDTVVLFISGHGMHDPQDNQYYFLTHETDLKQISSTAASFETLENLLQDIKPRRKLFLMDTCESGEQTEFVSPSTQEELKQKGLQMRGFTSVGSKNQANPPHKHPDFLFEKDRFIHNDLFRRSGTVVFSSSQGGEFSYEPRIWHEKGNGFFTQAVLEGLKGQADQNGDSNLLKQELFTYVRERVKALTHDKQHPTIDRDNLKQELQFKLPVTTQ